MPLYEYKCESCGHTWDNFSSVSSRNEPLEKPCPKCNELNVRMNFGAPPIADPVRLGRIKAPEGFRDVLRNVKAKHYKSTLDIN